VSIAAKAFSDKLVAFLLQKLEQSSKDERMRIAALSIIRHLVNAAGISDSVLINLSVYTSKLTGTRWPSGTVPDFAIERSWVRLPPLAAVYQCQLSVPSLRGRLMSTSKSWGVNGHTMRCTSPVSVVLQLRLVSG